jgi:class 3 adenylate cyclase/tetratricopeptide (TPR) repeat protein
MAACSECGRGNPEASTVCEACGAQLRARDVGEVRKTVTVLFCDVTGSTALAERLDPESMRMLISRYFQEMKSVLERHGGTVEKFIGDAVMAVFGIPIVHEDDALRAVRAAAEMRTTLTRLNAEFERDRGVRIDSRIGVATGEVVAGDPSSGQTLVTGDTVNVAARLQQAAAPGQILLDGATHRLVRAAVASDPVEPLTVKGKTDPIPAFALLDVRPSMPGRTPRRDVPMVGRKHELNALRDALDGASRERRGIRMTVIGAAGVGKSRLVDEFTALQTEIVVTHGRCLSYGDGITYWPVVEVLTTVAGIEDTDRADEIRSKIGRLLEGTADATVVAERLTELLGLTGATAAPEETHWAVRRLFEALASTRPVAAVFEDVHWAEPALLDLLDEIVDLARDAPILLLCTARPELLEERPGWVSPGPRAVAITIEPLSDAEADELVEHLVGASALPDEARSIIETAEGNPLFLEQIVGMLIDEGHLRREDGRWAVVDDLSSLSIPTTIKGVLEARLERLPRTEREVLERGSIEGREFHHASVASPATEGTPSQAGAEFTGLVRRGLIEPARPLLGGGEAFRFRHALIRDAAYARVPKVTRAWLHERHARWLERSAGERVPEFEEVIAYHLERATALRADLGPLDRAGRALGEEAARRLAAGGRRAAARGDMRAAANLTGRALALLDEDDAARPELQVRLGEALFETGEGDRRMEPFEHALAAARKLGDERIEIRAQVEMAMLRTQVDPEGSSEEIRRIAEEGIPILERIGDDEGLARTWKALGEEALMRADPVDLTEAYERTAFHAERAGDRAVLADALGWLSLIPWWGYTRPHESIRRAREIRSRLPDDRTVEALTDISVGYSLALLGHIEEGREIHRGGIDLLWELGQRIKAAALQDTAAKIEMLAGDYDAAERETRKGIDALRSMGELGYLSTQAAMLGEWLYQLGRDDEAEEMTHESEDAAASDDTISQVQWRGVRAKVLARRGDADIAITVAHEGAEIARSTGMWDLRADSLRDLGEVYRLIGHLDDAITTFRESLDVVEEKGAVPLIERDRARLRELETLRE